MSDDDLLQTVFVAATITEADLVKGLLETHGIPALVQGADMVSMLDGMVTGNKGVSVVVTASSLEEARRVIEENHHPADEDEEEDADD